MRLGEAAGIALELAEGLLEAHRRGVVDRFVLPPERQRAPPIATVPAPVLVPAPAPIPMPSPSPASPPAPPPVVAAVPAPAPAAPSSVAPPVHTERLSKRPPALRVVETPLSAEEIRARKERYARWLAEQGLERIEDADTEGPTP